MADELRPVDADNHSYETLDAFTRHLDRAFKDRGVRDPVSFIDELVDFTPEEVHRIMRANCVELMGLATVAPLQGRH
jgi:hypothetical protein